MPNRIAVTGFDLFTVGGVNLESNLNSLKSKKGLTSSFDQNWNQIHEISNKNDKDFFNIIKQSVYNAIKLAGLLQEVINIQENSNLTFSIVSGSNFFETNIWESEIKDNSLLWVCNFAVNKLARELKINGPVISISTACSSGASAIVTACQLIESGESDVAIVIGYDVRTRIPENGMRVIGALSKTMISPFSLNRTGTDLADGIGVVILERPDIAKSRNAKVYASIIGYGVTSDAYNITAPDPEGIALENAMGLAIQKSEIGLSNIQYINAHGSGTQLNDELETRVLKRVFGVHAKDLHINSSKSIIGHTLGAAGLIESIITVLALENGWIHPTANYTEPDPQCDLNYCTEGCVHGDFKYAMSNSIGFGGTNVSIVFEKGGLNEE